MSSTNAFITCLCHFIKQQAHMCMFELKFAATEQKSVTSQTPNKLKVTGYRVLITHKLPLSLRAGTIARDMQQKRCTTAI